MPGGTGERYTHLVNFGLSFLTISLISADAADVLPPPNQDIRGGWTYHEMSRPVDVGNDRSVDFDYYRKRLLLNVQSCKEYGEGCHSCVADGIWGALWYNADCSTRCDKVCGSEPAR